MKKQILPNLLRACLKSCSLLILGVMFSTMAYGADSLSQSSTQLKGVNAKIVTLKKNIQLTQAQRLLLQKTLNETDKNIAKIKIELQKLAQQRNEQHTTLLFLKEQVASLEKNLAYQKKVLGKQLRASYQMGQYEYLQVVLNQQDPGTVLRLMTYYNYINKARLKTLANIQQTEKEIQDKQELVLKQVDQLNQLTQKDEQKNAVLQQSQQKRQQILAKLNVRIQTQSSKLKEYEADKKRLEALLARLRKAPIPLPKSVTVTKSSSSPSSSPIAVSPSTVNAVAWGSFAKAAHHLMWPTQGRILNRALEPVLSHEPGVVILAPEGQRVVSIFPGRVVFADGLKGFGLLIIIDHGQGFMTLYANNQTLYRKRGDAVKAGDLISNVGHTGILAKSGLYFEIRHQGKPLSPLQWLAPPLKASA